mgnify:CR=1 FL=1
MSSGILTKDEAREILFSQQEETERDSESLKAEIKFLRELVEKLSNRSQIIREVEIVKVPYYHYPWYQPYGIWCGGTIGTSGTATYATATGGTTGLMANATGGNGSAQNCSFSDIKTF